MANPIGILTGGAKILGALGGLFGKKPKQMTPQQSIESTAAGARSAAEKYGFNALTLLQQSNATGGAGMTMGGGPPPLASLSVLGEALEQEYGQDTKDRREHNRLQNELLALDLQRERVLANVPKGAVASVGSGPPTVGNQVTRASVGRVTIPAFFGTPGGLRYGITPSAVAGDGRKVEVEPEKNIPGTSVIENAATGGPVTILDPDTFDAPLANAGLASAQVAGNHARNLGNWTSKNWWNGGNAVTFGFNVAKEKADKFRKGPSGRVWNPAKGGWVKP